MRFLNNEELNRPDLEQFSESTKLPVIVVLDNVRSGSNVGSVFRTCDAFAVQKLILCGITAKPPEREILKTALGATESVVWEYFESTSDALMQLKSNGFEIQAVEQADSSVALNKYKENWSGSPLVLVFGNEVKGVDRSLISILDGCIEVPQSGTKHSLNVSVCVGVVLWEMYRK